MALQDTEICEEKIEKIVNEFSSLPLPALGRNDLCFCDSGLKYKRCCLPKSKRVNSSDVPKKESFRISFDALTPEESKNSYEPFAPEDDELMSQLYSQLQENPGSIQSEDCDYFGKLNELKARYPNNPLILNYLACGYSHLKLEDKMEEILCETVQKFPDYLFAKAAQAKLYLRAGLPEKAFALMNRAYTLKQMYPHRDTFHYSEVKAFEQVMVHYFCSMKDFEQAERHLNFMKSFVKEDDPFLRSAIANYNYTKAKLHLNLLKNTRK